MTDNAVTAEQFSFVHRPIPIPGDLRLSWRIPILLLMLEYSRQRKASLIKLHVLNDAIRSSSSTDRLRQILSNQLPAKFWQPRIEPAFARAIDFASGDGFVTWINTTNGPGLSLLTKGKVAISKIIEMPEVLVNEKQVISDLADTVTERTAKSLLVAARFA